MSYLLLNREKGTLQGCTRSDAFFSFFFFAAGGVAGGIPTVTKSATGHSCACAPRHADRVLYNFAHGPSSCAFPSNHLLNALWLDQIREAERVSPGDPSSRERLLGRNRGFVCNYANLQPCKLDFLIYRILFGIRIDIYIWAIFMAVFPSCWYRRRIDGCHTGS